MQVDNNAKIAQLTAAFEATIGELRLERDRVVAANKSTATPSQKDEPAAAVAALEMRIERLTLESKEKDQIIKALEGRKPNKKDAARQLEAALPELAAAKAAAEAAARELAAERDSVAEVMTVHALV